MNKTLLISLFFVLLLVCLVPDGPHFDYKFHFTMAGKEFCPAPYEPARCEAYPPLSSIALRFAASSWTMYYFSCVLIVALIIPFLLFQITQRWESALLYFATSIPYYSLKFGTVANSFAIIWFLLFVWQRNVWVRLVLLFSSLVVHSLAPYLLLLYWLFESISSSDYLNWFFVPFVPNVSSLNFGVVKTWLWSTCPLIFVEGVGNALNSREFHWLLLAASSALFSLGVGRAFWAAQIALIIPASRTNFTTLGLLFIVLWADLVFLFSFGYIQPYLGWW